MSSCPHLIYNSNCQFNPDEVSEIMSAMAEENSRLTFSSGTFSNGAISPCQTLDDENALMGLCNNTDGVDAVSSLPVVSLSQQPPFVLGMFDQANPTSMLDYKMGLWGDGAIGTKNFDHNFGGGSQLLDALEFGGDFACYGSFKSSFMPPLASANPSETWGGGCCGMPVIEQNNVKVGRYTEEERRDRILRYLKKRNQRNFNKTIKYACRKQLADRRVRVRGRFARNNELRQEESCRIVTKDENFHIENESNYINCDPAQMKLTEADDEKWLQEAIASLLCVPYIAG